MPSTTNDSQSPNSEYEAMKRVHVLTDHTMDICTRTLHQFYPQLQIHYMEHESRQELVHLGYIPYDCGYYETIHVMTINQYLLTDESYKNPEGICEYRDPPNTSIARKIMEAIDMWRGKRLRTKQPDFNRVIIWLPEIIDLRQINAHRHDCEQSQENEMRWTEQMTKAFETIEKARFELTNWDIARVKVVNMNDHPFIPEGTYEEQLTNIRQYATVGEFTGHEITPNDIRIESVIKYIEDVGGLEIPCPNISKNYAKTPTGCRGEEQSAITTTWDQPSTSGIQRQQSRNSGSSQRLLTFSYVGLLPSSSSSTNPSTSDHQEWQYDQTTSEEEGTNLRTKNCSIKLKEARKDLNFAMDLEASRCQERVEEAADQLTTQIKKTYRDTRNDYDERIIHAAHSFWKQQIEKFGGNKMNRYLSARIKRRRLKQNDTYNIKSLHEYRRKMLEHKLMTVLDTCITKLLSLRQQCIRERD